MTYSLCIILGFSISIFISLVYWFVGWYGNKIYNNYLDWKNPWRHME